MKNTLKYLSLAIVFCFGIQSQGLNAQTAVTAQDDEIPVDDAIPAEEENADVSEAATPSANSASAVNPAPAYPELIPVFKQFGEQAGLVKLMDVFMDKMLADPRMRPFFENADQTNIKKHLVEQFCVILGGQCSYTGRDMKSSHAALGIDRADFNALVEDLQWAMNKQSIPFRAQNKLLAKLAPMHREIESRVGPAHQ